MLTRAERGVLFLTAPPELAARIARDVKARAPATRWTAYVRASEAGALGAALDGVEVVSDKPTGSKLAFVRAIRRRRFGLAVIAWTGHRSYDRMKLVGLASGARHCLVYNENLDCFYLGRGERTWLRHLRWRVSSGLSWAPAVTGSAVGLYKWTLGLLVACAWLAGRLSFWTWRRRRNRAALTGWRAS